MSDEYVEKRVRKLEAENQKLRDKLKKVVKKRKEAEAKAR